MANIDGKNNSAALYVRSTLKVHNPLFSVGKLLRNKLMQRFYWSIQSNERNAFERCALSGRFHNRSTQLILNKLLMNYL